MRSVRNSELGDLIPARPYRTMASYRRLPYKGFRSLSDPGVNSRIPWSVISAKVGLWRTLKRGSGTFGVTGGDVNMEQSLWPSRAAYLFRGFMRPVLKHGPRSLTCARVIGYESRPKGEMKVNRVDPRRLPSRQGRNAKGTMLNPGLPSLAPPGKGHGAYFVARREKAV